jgi:hypothetical protein
MGGRQKTMTDRGKQDKKLQRGKQQPPRMSKWQQRNNREQTGGMTNSQNMSRCWPKRGNAGIYIKAPYHTLTIIMERSNPSIVKQGWFDDRPRLVTVNIKVYVVVVRSDITARWAAE